MLSTAMKSESKKPAAGKFISRRTKGRLVRWVGLLALAGLLAMATLPSSHRDAGNGLGVDHITADQGVSTWHG
ncbi:MAG TPA: hypothetical protein VG742_17440 [Dongiaceae bacterium]|nr:hypothetical protein [Dongiaceae bacterium]